MRRSFQKFTDAELGFLSALKAEHRHIPASADLFLQGDIPAAIFTAFGGWSYRYRLFGDGRRQILGIVLPGELVGLPGAAFGRHAYSLRAATDAEFCALSLARLPKLLREQESLTMRLLWLASHEQRKVERLATSLGRCSADETLAAFVLDLHGRLERRDMLEQGGRSFAFPLSQVDMADHLGMTVVHLNRVLRRLEEENTLFIRRGRIEIPDLNRLSALSCLHGPEEVLAQPVP